MVRVSGRLRGASDSHAVPLAHPLLLMNSGTGGAFAPRPPVRRPPLARLSKRCRRRKAPILLHLTVALVKTYRACNPKFRYDTTSNPRRVLTKPSLPHGNNGHDNQHADLIIAVGDMLQSENESPVRKFRVIDLVGHGTFGQVVKCDDLTNRCQVAVKVIKNKPAYYNQAFMEIRLLKLLNEQCDPKDENHIVRLKDNFMHKNHLCLAFEVLNLSLYDTLKRSNHRGLALDRIRTICNQILRTLTLLRHYRIIHCDLKPENILLTGPDADSDIKVIDFGSACFDYQTIYSYIQSRFYRAPEILLQIPYHSAIDVWSLGCIAAELYSGLPLFPGVDEPDQMRRIVNICGSPPQEMLNRGAGSDKFFQETTSELRDHIRNSGVATPHSLAEAVSVRQLDPDHECFLDFLSGMLQWTPELRWTPQQASTHPFITRQPFTGPYVPALNATFHPSTPQKITRGAPPQYSYSGHRLGGGQVGSASGVGMHQAFQRMTIAIPPTPFVRLQLPPQARQRRGSATHLTPGYAVPYSPMMSPGVDWQTPFSPMASPGRNSYADWDPYFTEAMPLPSPAAFPRQRRSSMPSGNPYIDQYSVAKAPVGTPAHSYNRANPWL